MPEIGSYQGGTGTFVLGERSLKLETIEYISILIGSKNIELDREAFFQRITDAVNIFIGAENLQRESGAAIRQKNLEAAKLAAIGFAEALASLDGNSKAIIQKTGASYGQMLEFSKKSVHALAAAVEISDRHPPVKGRQAENYRYEFAAEVESAFLDFSDHVPSPAADGLFAEVLAAILSEISGRASTAASGLARAVAGKGIRVKEQGGLIYYRQVT